MSWKRPFSRARFLDASSLLASQPRGPAPVVDVRRLSPAAEMILEDEAFHLDGEEMRIEAILPYGCDPELSTLIVRRKEFNESKSAPVWGRLAIQVADLEEAINCRRLATISNLDPRELNYLSGWYDREEVCDA